MGKGDSLIDRSSGLKEARSQPHARLSLESVPRELRCQASAVSHWIPETDGMSEIIKRQGAETTRPLGSREFNLSGQRPLSQNQQKIHV